ncbi:MAG: N-acetylmuramoyl-L-alanine amidase [Fluviicola sp.]|nr:N-acetylmuramoyl-L-alanine amidase [Fluviicola sp.]
MKFLLALLLLVVTQSFSFAQKDEAVVIMIDPGHGGSDPGHESVNKNHLPEKELNLIIAKKVGDYLSTKVDNVTIIYTRTTDIYLSLDQRVELANSKKVDFFISIHCNGNPDTKINGTETHVHSMSSKKSVKLAREIEKDFRTKAGRKSRGVKDTDDREHTLQVLKFTEMTSVLVECGFLTNPKEAAYLNTTSGQDIIASAIYRGIKNYLKTENGSQTAEKPVAAKENPKEKPAEEGSWTVQIMSSKEWMDTEKGNFKQLSQPVKREQVAQTGYKYIYYSGNFTSVEAAKKYRDEVKKNGFTDAIVVQKK